MIESEEQRRAGIWEVTRETSEIEAKHRQEEAARKELELGLAKCPVCKGAAKIVEFGIAGEGIWIGCDRTDECSRYIEIHTEGWSVWEVAEEWSRYNSGVFLLIRRVKRWFRKHLGAEKRREKRENRKKLEEKRAEEAKRREILGLEPPKREGIWVRILARWQKVGGTKSVRTKIAKESSK